MDRCDFTEISLVFPFCSREPPEKLELPCFECCVFGEPKGFLGGGNWKSTGFGKNGDESVTGILQKWKFHHFQTDPPYVSGSMWFQFHGPRRPRLHRGHSFAPLLAFGRVGGVGQSNAPCGGTLRRFSFGTRDVLV